LIGQHDDVALTKAERQKADDLIQRLLDLVDDGHLAADGPAGVALARRLEGAVLALRAMEVIASEIGQSPPETIRSAGRPSSDV
jgi:hypothetical protein